MIYKKTVDSPLGPILLASDGDALTGLWLAGQKYYAAGMPADAEQKNIAVFDRVEAWLARYFAGKNPSPDFAVKPQGSAFRQRVWQTLLEIPYGETTSYGALAEKLKSAPRAVGGAVGHNPVSIIIPCHRVVGKSGALTGYAGGLGAKEQLLKMERAN